MTTPHFSITRHRTPIGALRVKMAGDFDLSIGDTLTDALLDAARTPGITDVVVDLDETRFIDSHVLASLVAGYQAALAAQRGFSVVNGHGTVQEVLDTTGLSEVLCP